MNYTNPAILEHQYRDITLIRNVWTEILKSATDSIMFNQVLYWSSEDRKGSTKLRVKRDGHLWIAKTYFQWSEELYIPAPTVKDAIKRLTKINLIHTASFMFGGLRTLHIRINWDTYSKLLQENFDLNFPDEFRDADMTQANRDDVVIPKVEKTPKKKEEVTITTDDANKVLQVWNDHRGSLPEAQSLSTARKRNIQKYLHEYGLDKTLDMMEKATKAVATDDWWNGKNPAKKKYGIDSLFYDDKIVSKSENYNSAPIKGKLDIKVDSYKASQQLEY